MVDHERIPDPSDQATAYEETMRAAAVSARKPEGPKPCGQCLNCEHPLPDGERWCDATCRDEWELFAGREEAALRVDGE